MLTIGIALLLQKLIANTGISWIQTVFNIIVAVILLLPIFGYNDPKCIKTVKLLPLRRGLDDEHFVERNGKKVIYAIDVREKISAEITCYEEFSYSSRTKIYESLECEEPILKIFKITPLFRGGITISPFFARVERVFIIPRGTVLKISKNVNEKE